jgi:hypothetical protein
VNPSLWGALNTALVLANRSRNRKTYGFDLPAGPKQALAPLPHFRLVRH